MPTRTPDGSSARPSSQARHPSKPGIGVLELFFHGLAERLAVIADGADHVVRLGDVHTRVDHCNHLLQEVAAPRLVGPAARTARDRIFPERTPRWASRSSLIQLIRGLARTGQDVSFLYEMLWLSSS